MISVLYRNHFFSIPLRMRNHYIFWFKLESEKYINEYWTEYYAYPKYDLPYNAFCGWWGDCNIDMNLMIFRDTISEPCE